MFEALIGLSENLAGGSAIVLLIGLGARMEFMKRSTEKLIIEGSEDIKHERALKMFESSFDTFTRCGGFATRKIQADSTLVGKPLDIAYQFNAKWNDEWTRMLRSVSGATYKKNSLELFVHSALDKWVEKREIILECLLEQMADINIGTGKISSLEDELLSFKHELEYGSENWLNYGYLFGKSSNPKKRLLIKKPFVEEDIEDVEVEVYEPDTLKVG